MKALRFLAPAYLLASLACLAAGLGGRVLNVDEAWIGEQAWFFSQEGSARSDLFAGYESSEARILVYHRLIVWTGAGVVRLLGFGLPQLRLISLASALALLALLARSREATGATLRFGPPAILVSMFLFYRFAGYYRPEAMLALLAWIQWCFVLRAAKTGKALFALLAGASGGLGILAHLNGLAFAAGSAAALVYARKPGNALLSASVAAAVGLGPVALEAAGEPSLFLGQFTGEFVRTKTSLSALTPFLNLAREHQRLFRDPGMILVTLTTAAAFLSGGRRRISEAPLFYIFSIASLVALAAITGSKSAKYAIPLMPFAACEIWAGLERALSGKDGPRWRRWPVLALSAALVCFGGISTAILAASPAQDLAEENRAAGELIPDGSSCVAPIGFVFDEIGRVRIFGLYLAERTGDEGLTSSGLLAFAREREAEYVVLDSSAASALGDLPDSQFTQLRTDFPQVYRIGAGGSGLQPSFRASCSALRSSARVNGFRREPSKPFSL